MKAFIAGILDVLIVFALLTAGITAVPGVAAGDEVGSYEGTFQGMAYADKNSSAPLVLELTHRGNEVEGGLFLGEGLVVNGGLCGTVSLPEFEVAVEGETVRSNPNRLVADPTFDAGGFDLTVDFESEVSTDGEVITATAKVDLPWFCGRDPGLTAILYRD
jgi:hypothetical protein